jgi:enediyne biosynthesis protein CalE3
VPITLAGDIVALHASMLADKVRTDAFRRAIDATVKPGDVVCDLGAGTGILALFAASAGARRVFAVEEGPVAAIARDVLAANDPGGIVELVVGRSTSVDLPERADVLISETLWNLGVGEGIIHSVRDARRRLLVPDARVVPQRMDLLVAPVESPKPYRLVQTWTADLYGLDFTPLRQVASNVVHASTLGEDDVLAAPTRVGTVDLVHGGDDRLHATLRFEARRAGILHGLGGWFDAALAPGVRLSNAPPNAARSWAQAFLPLGEPVQVQASDTIDVSIALALEGEQWLWSVTASGVEQRGSTLGGSLLSLAALRRTAPARRPVLSERGTAVMQLLEWLDGTTPVSDLGPRLREHYPRVFPSDEAAEELVRDVLERCT